MGAPGSPERTCVGCRGRASKRELLRIVRAPDGGIRLDPQGTAAGRGAYVHRDVSCVRAAVSRSAILRALRVGATPDAAARLMPDVERNIEEALRG